MFLINLNIFASIPQTNENIFYCCRFFLPLFQFQMPRVIRYFTNPRLQSGIAYLTYYYGKNINIEDSAVVNNKGVAIFQKNEKLLPGVYSIVFPGKNKLFDFLVDKEQIITIKADTSDLINKTT